ncbi:MAG: menaquinone-dependent protoporphyrinogen IX dehydrogenase [Gammaproteobacteria bacterium]|nr:menaquinone-dependent protoporphyrinogen IX dehydrogenase [Gammaproteobacteria bacterium]
MARFLLLYSTVDGHTRAICERVARRIEAQGHEVSQVSLDDDGAVDPVRFDRVVIGASIRYGRHRDNVLAFVRRHAETLQRLPAALFSVSLVARKPHRAGVDSNPYLKRFLAQVPWQPRALAVFAGKLNYPLYGFWDRQVIRLIMWMTGGPTRPDAVVDYTDWHQVDAFADRVAAASFGDEPQGD